MAPPPIHRPRLFAALALGVLAVIGLVAVTRQPVAPLERTDAAKTRAKRLQAALLPAIARPGEEKAALNDFLAGRPFVLVENGQPRRFLLALDKLYLPSAPVSERWQAIPPQPDVNGLLALAATMAAETGGWPGLVVYPAGQAEVKEQRRVLTARWLLRYADRLQAIKAVDAAGFEVVDEPDYAPGHLVVAARAGGAAAALRAAMQLQGHESITSISPMLLRQRSKKGVPNDTLFPEQWHLQNTGQGAGTPGKDIAVTSVWNTYQGEGIRIGIVDDGIEMGHPDLAPNVDTANDYDWNDADNDASADPLNEDIHGTAVAGVAGARGGNALGVSGVAPQAKLVGFRLIADEYTNDQMEAESVTRANDIIQVKNNSWGFPDGLTDELGWTETLTIGAMATAATTGRGGLGTISTWAAGNGRQWGDQGNKDAYSNSIYGISVGAVTNKGDLAPYSEGGSHLMVVAPASGGTRKIVTTDFRGVYGFNDSVKSGELTDTDYTNGFGGTSASAPIVAGVAALMLQANPQLGWRDVKEILLRSSTKLFPTDSGWVSRTGGAGSELPPIKQHEKFGGGLVNAEAATAMAESWTNLGPMLQESRTVYPQARILDNDTTGVAANFDFSNVTSLRVEHVTVRVNITHAFRGDLQITLQSPSGVISTLASKTIDDFGTDYPNWTFSSVRHWGEGAQGTWVVSCKDQASGDDGTFWSATVTLFGSEAAPVAITSDPLPLLVAEGESAAFSAGSTGYGHIEHQWKKNNASIGTDAATHTIASTTIADGGTYQAVVSNVTATVTSAAVPLGVVRRAVPSQTLNEGATCTFKAMTGGPGLTFAWFRNGEPVENGTRISGAQAAALVIKSIQSGDAGSYVCRASLSALPPVDTLPATLTVRLKPVVHAPDMENGIVSGTVSYQFTADNDATRFAASGLPGGVTFNTTTGVLSGTPSTANTYKIKVTATNSTGTSAPIEITWTVDKLPAAALGTFNGLIGRSPMLNNELGGRLNVVVSSTGALTGSLTLAGKTHRITGRLSATAVDVNPTAAVTIKRPAPLASLNLQFTIDLLTQQITGTVQDEASGPVALSAWRNDWIATRNATAYAGSYNAGLLLSSPNEGGEVPQGTGFARLTVTTSGIATWSGKLADGTALTGSTTLGPNGEVPLHAMLYTNTGSIQGWSQITGQNVDGAVDWLKTTQAPTSKTRSFKNGIVLHALDLNGARYTKPPPSQIVLGLTAGSDNARLIFGGDGLSADIQQGFEITPTNAVKLPTAAAANPAQVKMTLNATTGAISGSFTLKDADPRDTTPPIAVLTRLARFNGLLITRPEINRGVGHFNLAELPDVTGESVANTPLWPGNVTLDATPPPAPE